MKVYDVLIVTDGVLTPDGECRHGYMMIYRRIIEHVKTWKDRRTGRISRICDFLMGMRMAEYRHQGVVVQVSEGNDTLGLDESTEDRIREYHRLLRGELADGLEEYKLRAASGEEG